MTAALAHKRLTTGHTEVADRNRQRHEIESVARAVAGIRVTPFGSIEQDLGDWIEGIGRVLDEHDDLTEALAEAEERADDAEGEERVMRNLLDAARDKAEQIRWLLELSPGEIQQEAIDLAKEIEGLQ